MQFNWFTIFVILSHSDISMTSHQHDVISMTSKIKKVYFSHLFCSFCTIKIVLNKYEYSVYFNIFPRATAVKNSSENFMNKIFERKCIGHTNIGVGEGKKTAATQVR